MLPKQKHLNGGGGWEVKTAEGEDIKMLIPDKLHSTKDTSLMLEATGKETTALLVYAVVYEFMPSHQPQVNSFQDASSSSIWFKPPQFKLVSKFPISQSDRASMRYAGSPIQIGPILHQQESKETPSPPWCQTQTGTTCLMGLGSVWALLRSLLSSFGSVTGRTVLPSGSCCYEGVCLGSFPFTIGTLSPRCQVPPSLKHRM